MGRRGAGCGRDGGESLIGRLCGRWRGVIGREVSRCLRFRMITGKMREAVFLVFVRVGLRGRCLCCRMLCRVAQGGDWLCGALRKKLVIMIGHRELKFKKGSMLLGSKTQPKHPQSPQLPSSSTPYSSY